VLTAARKLTTKWVRADPAGGFTDTLSLAAWPAGMAPDDAGTAAIPASAISAVTLDLISPATLPRPSAPRYIYPSQGD
jgi:hypothetical protein